MNKQTSDFDLPIGFRRVIAYYLGYCFIFFLMHLSLVSIGSFFHFLIDHDMHIIENWLFTNAWELIIVSKIFASVIIIKALKLNNYIITNLFTILKTNRWRPSFSAMVLLIFLSIFLFALILQFGKGIEFNEKSSLYVMTSFIGSILFYLCDLLVINILLRNVVSFSRQKNSLLIFSILVIFIVTTKVTLPHVDNFFFLIILHFLTLLLLLFKERKNIMNIILYCCVVIGPLSSILGFDLVWENAHSVYQYNKTLPHLGIAGIWLIGIVYYFKTGPKNPA